MMMYDINKIKDQASLLTLLLVDDDAGARNHMKSFLSLLFKEVYEAENGKEALTIYEEKNVDILITDLLMPVMCGFDLIDAIRKLNSRQKIIIMSAQADKDTIVKAITYSVDGYILKPINEVQMFESIEKTISECLMERENQNYQSSLEEQVKEQVVEIQNYSQQMIDQLEHDTLTGLPNKEKLQLDYSKKSFSWLILCNIDNLEYINIAYGHYEGDLLIKSVAKLLRNLVGENVYRVSGDEFFVTSNLKDKDSVEKLAQEIHDKVYVKRFELTQASVRITFTMGIVPSDDDVLVPYYKAHLAIKQVRQKHKNGIGFYQDDPKLKSYHKEMNQWAYKTKLALEFDLLVPFYQPIINVQTKQIEKYECLARIVEKDSVIMPKKFIESSRIAGMIVDVTQRVILKSFETFAHSDKEFSINITDDDLKEEYLMKFLNKALKKYDIKPQQVVLEVLENVSDYDADHAQVQLQELKSQGYQIAIDDFGAESSNFARLQRLNIDYIKIDGSFIKNINENKNSLNIVKTIIYYSKLSNVKTIAEYVHNKAVYETLVGLGIDYVQGYYLYEPLKDVG